eukprot:c25294_g1_i1 orf=597-1196(-)
MPRPPALLLMDHNGGHSDDQLQICNEPRCSSVRDSSVEVLETVGISVAAVGAKSPDTPQLTNPSEEPPSSGNQASPPPPQSKPRARVPLERGYTQMNWLKLTRTEPDLAGLKGQSSKRLIPMEEVKKHQSEEDAWTVLRGHIYNISPYLKFHPGGKDMLMKGAGIDCTSLFNKYHSWVNAEFLLEKCLVGHLDISQKGI